MREARLIVALRTNDGGPMDFLHRHLRHEIAGAYGGLTITSGRGVWVDAYGKLFDEPCVIYDVVSTTTVRSCAPSQAG